MSSLYAENIPHRQQGEHANVPDVYERVIIYQIAALLGLDPVDVISIHITATSVQIVHVVGTALVSVRRDIGSFPEDDE